MGLCPWVLCQRKLEEDVGPVELESYGLKAIWCGCRESNSGPLQDMLLTTETFPQSWEGLTLREFRRGHAQRCSLEQGVLRPLGSGQVQAYHQEWEDEAVWGKQPWNRAPRCRHGRSRPCPLPAPRHRRGQTQWSEATCLLASAYRIFPGEVKMDRATSSPGLPWNYTLPCPQVDVFTWGNRTGLPRKTSVASF